MNTALAVLALVLGAHPASQEADHLVLDRDATTAFRAGDHATARGLWIDALALDPPPGERARIAYNLGNAAYRRGTLLEAVGWYTASLRHAPREPDAWTNLELARAEAGLEPADRGDLAATLGRLVSGLTRAEAEWLLAAAILGWAVLLAAEALRGGSWRIGARLGLVGVALAALPLVWHATRPGHPMLVIDSDGAPARSEPRGDAKSLARLEAGAIVDREDELPGWVKVSGGEVDGLWVREGDLFDLLR